MKGLINTTELLNKISDTIVDKSIKTVELTNILEQHGFKYIGSGLDRKVYVSPNKQFVVKIEKYRSGKEYSQIHDEVKTLRVASKTVKKYLLPILAYATDYSWIIFPYANTDNKYRVFCKLDRIFNKKGIRYGDFGFTNVGEYQGKPYLIDYGFTEVIERGQEIKGES